LSTPARDTAAPGLRPEQLAAFARDGFLFPVPVLEPGELDEVRAAVDAIRADLPRHAGRLYEVEQAYAERPDEVVCHFLGGWLVQPLLRALVSDRRITVPCAQALGVRRLRFFHDQVFYKPAGHPGAVPWHQDYSYWTRTEPANHVTLNLMLDDADPQSGCVQFVPGSHRFGLLPKVPFDAEPEQVLAHLTPAERAAFRPVPAPLRAGSASLHHSHVLHGSGPNRSPRPRRALVFNYMGAATRVADDARPLLNGVPWLPRGAVIDGPHFPVVLDLDA
jgi:hypothetical protein